MVRMASRDNRRRRVRNRQYGFRFAHRGQEQNRNRTLATQFFRKFETALTWHHHVDDQQVKVENTDLPVGLVGCRSRRYAIAVFAQELLEEVAKASIVVDHQYVRRHAQQSAIQNLARGTSSTILPACTGKTERPALTCKAHNVTQNHVTATFSNTKLGRIAMAGPSFDDRDGHIWFDGAMLDWRDAKVHILTHAMHYASAVFEGERAYGGEIFKVREHHERLAESARALGFELPYSVDAITQAARDVLDKNNIVDGYIRPVAWRGAEMMGVSAQETKIHLSIAAWPWPSYFSPEARLKGIRLKTARWRRPAPDTAPVKTKAAGLYMICTLSKHEVEAEGFDDALMLDWRGRVAECTGANIFLVQEGVLHTPTPDCFLDGITRRTVIELAEKRGYRVVDRVIMPEELANSEEVFVTGTAAEVTPVSQIDDLTFKVGIVGQQMMEDYDALVNQREPKRIELPSEAAAE